MANARNENRQSSSVDNTAATYNNQGPIYNAPVSHQRIVQEKAVTYNVDRTDTDLIERFSMFLMKTLGGRNTILSAIASGGLGLLALLSGIYRSPSFLASHSQSLMYLAFGLILVGVALWAAVQYRHESRCAKCNAFYAMKEVGEPTEREVPVRGGVRRTTTRFFQCSMCSNEMTKKSNHFIEDDQST